MTTFTITLQGGSGHTLREAETVDRDRYIAVAAERICGGARAGVRLRYVHDSGTGITLSLDADLARSIAAELLASADAIDAVIVRGKP